MPISRSLLTCLRGRESGIALVKVLLLTTILVGLAAFGARGTRLELRISRNDLLAKRAFAIAEAGAQHAFGLVLADMMGCAADCFDDELQNDGTGGSLAAIADGTTAIDGASYRALTFGDGQYAVRMVDNNDDADLDDDADHRVRIVSRGTMGGAIRIVEMSLEPSPLFGGGIFAKERVRFTGGGETDSYEGSYDPLNPGHEGDVGSNGDIDLSGQPTTIDGSATAGGEIDTGTSTITGSQTEGAPPQSFAPVTPCNTTMGYSSGSDLTPYTPINTRGNNAGELRVNNGSVTLDPAYSPYCFKSITLNGGGEIRVEGAVEIYLTHPTDLSGGSITNTTHDASNLRIYSSYVSTNDTQGLRLAGGSDAYMTVYAPDTAITLTGGGDFYGALVGKTVTVNGGAHVHYDENLESIAVGARVSGWHEVRY